MMQQQIKFVTQRDGLQEAIAYARRALHAYQNAARYRNKNKRHFCHNQIFRQSYVLAIMEIRGFLRQTKGKEE